MKYFNALTFPILKTGKLVIRQANFDDIKVIFELRSSKEINEYVATKRVRSFHEAKDFIILCNQLYINKKRIFWLIEFEQVVIGSIVLHNISLKNKYAEIGYKLKPAFYKKGIMSKVIKEVLKFGFEEIDLKIIEAFTDKKNVPSIALLKKHDFIFQPKRKDEGFNNNRIFKLEKEDRSRQLNKEDNI